MTRRAWVAIGALAIAGAAMAQQGPGDPVAVEDADGKYYDAEGFPTYNIAEDGTVDFHTYSGFRRYHSECHVCHGPDGEGSSYAPNLRESATAMNYLDFTYPIVNGRQNVHGGTQNVMPAFGDNPNVMCYLDDIYVYLRARGQGELPRGRPEKKEAKSATFTEDENACMGTG